VCRSEEPPRITGSLAHLVNDNAAGIVIARSASVARRIAALFGFFAVLALALMLLYRVYVHHERSEPLVEDDEGLIVRMDVPPVAPVKFARGLR
jgi:hypothetical protein